MGRSLWKLNALAVQKAKEPGMYSDGGGLYLRVAPEGSRSWVFRYKFQKVPRAMGLGSVNVLSLAGARNEVMECRKLLLVGQDPISARKAQRTAHALTASRVVTF